MKKILCVFGTRPEAIKMAPVIHALQSNSKFAIEICVTAQHRSMLDQTLNLFDIKPDYDLNIMLPNQTLSNITINILNQLAPLYATSKPDLVLVQGDTTSSFVAALSAYYHQIPVAHIEAGLRTYNPYSPWPEEGNRKLLSQLSAIHFTPTTKARDNLLKEFIPKEKIFVTGNTVIDALLMVRDKIKQTCSLQDQLNSQFSFLDPRKKLILVTGHRRENFGRNFKNICMALRQLALDYHDDLEIVYPVHWNPQVQQPVNEILKGIKNVHLIEPQEYLSFVYLMERCYLILTDSGGIQEEAPSLGKPVLVFRLNTERPEGIEAGTVKLIGTEISLIVKETMNLFHHPEVYQQMSQVNHLYGDGRAAEKIIAALQDL